jgi:methionine sulfoxide reductase heme-binding subunit
VKDPTFWILARASGLTAYVLLTFSVLAGLTVKSKPFKTLRLPAVTDLHRFLALLGLGAVAIHGITLVLDTTVKITPAALLLPGLVPYRPAWTALGVLAGELMALIYVSFALRKRIGMKNWRRLHYATYAIFALATVHGLAAGTDSTRPWAIWLYLAAIGAVCAATAWRVLTAAPARPAPAGAPQPAPVPATDTPTGGTSR